MKQHIKAAYDSGKMLGEMASFNKKRIKGVGAWEYQYQEAINQIVQAVETIVDINQEILDYEKTAHELGKAAAWRNTIQATTSRGNSAESVLNSTLWSDIREAIRRGERPHFLSWVANLDKQ